MTESERDVRGLAAAADLPVSEEDLPSLAARWREISDGIERLGALIEETDQPLTVYRPGETDV